MSACPSACISTDRTEHISAKFDIGGIHENMSRKSELCSHRTKPPGTLHEYINTFYVALRYYIAINALCSMETVSDYLDSREVQTLRYSATKLRYTRLIYFVQNLYRVTPFYFSSQILVVLPWLCNKGSK